MLSALKWTIKWALITLAILTLGNWIHWNDQSLSEAVKITMEPLQRSPFIHDLKKWAEHLTHDAKQGMQKQFHAAAGNPQTSEEETTPSERQKLRSLIRELSSAQTVEN